jgi:hypothetical protein
MTPPSQEIVMSRRILLACVASAVTLLAAACGGAAPTAPLPHAPPHADEDAPPDSTGRGGYTNPNV